MPPDLDAYLEAHRQEHLDRLIAYLRIPSISAHGQGIPEAAEHARGLLERAGLGRARVIPTDGGPMVLAERIEHADRPTLLVYGHYDVQPPDPLEEWLSPPFEPTVRPAKGAPGGERLYARGVADNKAQHLAHVLAIESLVATEGRLPCNVRVLLDGEEEIGSPQMAPFVDAHRDELAADLCVISDGTVDESGRSVVRFGVRGVLSFELRARGANRDLHSGHWGDVAPNPLWTLVHLLATMKNDRGEVTIEGFYDAVEPMTQLERDALERLGEDVGAITRQLGLTELAPHPGGGVAERRAAWPAFTINGLHGGYGGAGSKTVLPHEAFAKCDIRLVEAQSADDVWRKLVAHVRRHAPGVGLIHHGSMEPSKTPLDSPYAAPLGRALAAVEGQEPLLLPAMGGSLPEYVFTKTLGVPCFGVPFGNPDQANHAPNENLELARFFRGIRTAAAILRELGADR
jgi:acetylornithine deacetylase/succinyl-diaminopimelate desuccinylase-like protein